MTSKVRVQEETWIVPPITLILTSPLPKLVHLPPSLLVNVSISLASDLCQWGEGVKVPALSKIRDTCAMEMGFCILIK